MAKTLIGTPLVLTPTDTALCEYDITSGIDDTYSVYEFHFVNMHPVTNNVNFTFQVNAHDGSSQLTGFDEAITSTTFRAYHHETAGSGGGGTLAYDTSSDQATSDGNGVFQRILNTGTGYENDESSSGVLTLYDPSSTTHVKHFIANGTGYDHGNWTVSMHTAGYINTTNAITQISFKFDSGDIEAGTIKMFGVA